MVFLKFSYYGLHANYSIQTAARCINTQAHNLKHEVDNFQYWHMSALGQRFQTFGLYCREF